MRRVLAVLALVFAASCGDSPTESLPTMTGEWTGTSGVNTFTFTLNQTAGTISGSGNGVGSIVDIPLTVTGIYTHPSVSMTWTAPGHEPLNFQGTRNGNAVSGTVNGSGFVNSVLTLNKQ